MRFLVIGLLFSFPAAAEFLELSIKLSGLNCPSCARSIDRSLKRMKGIESVTYNEKESSADMKLAPGNTVTLGPLRDALIGPLRDALKGLGYTPDVILFHAKGRLRRGEQRALFFELEGVDAVFAAVPVVEVGFSGRLVEVTGTISPPRGPQTPDSMLIYTIKSVEDEKEKE